MLLVVAAGGGSSEIAALSIFTDGNSTTTPVVRALLKRLTPSLLCLHCRHYGGHHRTVRAGRAGGARSTWQGCLWSGHPQRGAETPRSSGVGRCRLRNARTPRSQGAGFVEAGPRHGALWGAAQARFFSSH